MNEPAHVVSWAKKLISRLDWVVVDTETTRINGEVVQMAIVSCLGEVLFDSLLKPTCPIDPGATAVHGITDAMVAAAPSLADPAVYRQLRGVLSGRVILAYNAKFDQSRLAYSCAAHRLPPLDDGCEWKDVMKPYAVYHGEYNFQQRQFRPQKLINACRQMGIEFNGAHSAIGDAQATLALIQKIAQVGG
jgi:DNA polymerase-3 subunit epsilon